MSYSTAFVVYSSGMADYLQYWKCIFAEDKDILRFAASKQFSRRHVGVGDTLWFVTITDGRLILLGSFEIGAVITRGDAIALFGDNIHPLMSIWSPDKMS